MINYNILFKNEIYFLKMLKQNQTKKHLKNFKIKLKKIIFIEFNFILIKKNLRY